MDTVLETGSVPPSYEIVSREYKGGGVSYRVEAPSPIISDKRCLLISFIAIAAIGIFVFGIVAIMRAEPLGIALIGLGSVTLLSLVSYGCYCCCRGAKPVVKKEETTPSLTVTYKEKN